MMGKTHMIAGIAAAAFIARPDTLGGCLEAILGGALGGLICDLDVQSSTYCRDAGIVRNAALVLGAGVLFLDWKWNTGIWNHISSHVGGAQMAGLGIFLAVTVIGKLSSHRSFTHSFLALGLLMASFQLLYAPLTPFVAAGFLSHIALDLLNKKPVEIFYPWKKGVCLRLCHADGIGNTVLFWVGILIILEEFGNVGLKLIQGGLGVF